MKSVFPDNEQYSSIQFRLSNDSVCVRESEEWVQYTVPEIRDKYPRDVMKELLIAVVEYGRGDFSRKEDTIVLNMSKPESLSLSFPIADKQYSNDGSLAKEKLSRTGLLKYNGKNIAEIDLYDDLTAHTESFNKALRKRSDGQLF